MLKKFFMLFAGCLAAVLVLGTVFIQAITEHNVVEYWILLMLPAFGIPILSAVLFSQHETDVI